MTVHIIVTFQETLQPYMPRRLGTAWSLWCKKNEQNIFNFEVVKKIHLSIIIGRIVRVYCLQSVHVCLQLSYESHFVRFGYPTKFRKILHSVGPVIPGEEKHTKIYTAQNQLQFIIHRGK